MMKSPPIIDELVAALGKAWHEAHPIDADPWSDALNDASQAYEAQERLCNAMRWFEAAPPRHWKSGGPNRRAVLTHAPLPPKGIRNSPASFDDWSFIAPGVEAEVALRLGEAIGPDRAASLTPENADAVIDAMTVSIEVVDSRWRQGSSAPALLRLADLQSHGGLVLGTWIPYAPRDWSQQQCETRVGQREVVRRTGTHPLGDPLWLLPIWLRHATRQGLTIDAGTVVTTGSWVGILPVARGETVTVDFPGIGIVQAAM